MTTTTETKTLLAKWADVAYRHQAEQVADNLTRIVEGLKVHKESQAENPHDWAYFGDLLSWNERLRDILDNPEVELDPFLASWTLRDRRNRCT